MGEYAVSAEHDMALATPARDENEPLTSNRRVERSVPKAEVLRPQKGKKRALSTSVAGVGTTPAQAEVAGSLASHRADAAPLAATSTPPQPKSGIKSKSKSDLDVSVVAVEPAAASEAGQRPPRRASLKARAVLAAVDDGDSSFDSDDGGSESEFDTPAVKRRNVASAAKPAEPMAAAAVPTAASKKATVAAMVANPVKTGKLTAAHVPPKLSQNLWNAVIACIRDAPSLMRCAQAFRYFRTSGHPSQHCAFVSVIYNLYFAFCFTKYP